MKKQIIQAACIAAVLLASFQLSGFAQPAREYYIVNSHFGDDLGMVIPYNGQVASGRRNMAGREARWILREERSGVFKIRPVSETRRFLCVSPDNNREVIVGFDAGPGYESNIMLWQKVDERGGTFKLKNLQTNQVLDASAGTRGKVQMWDDLGTSNRYVPNAANQRWRLVESNPRPSTVDDINCATASTATISTLIADLYDQRNAAEMTRFVNCLHCYKVLDAVSFSGLSPRLNETSSAHAAVRFAIKRRMITCLGSTETNLFNVITKQDLNRYFSEIPATRFCETLNAPATRLSREQADDHYKAIVRIYFAGSVHDTEEQNILKMLNCIPCDRVMRIVNHFTYREFNYKFDGSENRQFKELYNRCNR